MLDPIQLSPLGFGCAPIMGKIGKTQAMRAMSEAFDLGITHFDVARSYGFGRAEQVVGEFIKGKRNRVTITSKFGVVPPTLSLKTKTMIPAGRVALKVFPQLRKKLKRKSCQLLSERRYDVSYAEQCLNQSLSELSTDYIDIYLIHEPNTSILENMDEITSFLERNIIAGKIRRWGFAFGTPKDYTWAKKYINSDIIQYEANIETLPLCRPILKSNQQKIVTRPFIGGLTDTSELKKFNTVLQEINASTADLSLCLARHIAGQSGSVLCSMYSSEHIRKNVYCIENFHNNRKMIDLISIILKYKINNYLQIT